MMLKLVNRGCKGSDNFCKNHNKWFTQVTKIVMDPLSPLPIAPCRIVAKSVGNLNYFVYFCDVIPERPVRNDGAAGMKLKIKPL